MAHHLYRHYDKEKKLLYVGISISALKRLGQHKKHAHWFSQIALVTIEMCETREAALTAERVAVQTEKPIYNIQLKAAPVKEKTAFQQAVSQSKEVLTNRLVAFDVVYTTQEVARVLGLSQSAVQKLIYNEQIGFVVLPPHKEGGPPKVRITGWHLIEYLEWCETAELKERLKKAANL
jgi:predicted GIY-YIG superfamily endonuclease